MMTRQNQITSRIYGGKVYCPICTHTVDAEIEQRGRQLQVRPGQKCGRCRSSLDPAYIMAMDRAA